ncbi:MAG: ribose 5-phosphate isomerase B [Persicimonas sp.]
MVERTRSGEPSEAHEVADVVLAADHAGVEMKAMLQPFLRKKGLAVVDLGPADSHSVDYPDFAELLARQVASGQANAGILVCGSGIGMSIAANKVVGVRAALVTDPLMASLSRQHNNANILCLGARIIGQDMAKACVDAFLSTDFDPGDDGRHQRRVGRISEIERNTEC